VELYLGSLSHLRGVLVRYRRNFIIPLFICTAINLIKRYFIKRETGHTSI
jgi:hypothetical protein